MRLTLRTLLAYRDRVLNANELEDMHARIQQSAMASNLVKRLESLSHRTNILAPPIEGKGLGGDANSIAEYLDDTLKGDKVPELERICLESDVQLAELAQCHGLLSAALSTAIDVPGSLRQRIVGLSDAGKRGAELERKRHEPQAESVGHSASSTEEGDAASDAHRGVHSRVDAPHQATASASNDAKNQKSNGRVLVQAQAVTAPMVASGGDSIRPSGLDLEGSHLAHEVPEYLRGRSRDGWLGPVAIGALLCLLSLLVWQAVGSWTSVRDMLAEAPTEKTEPDTTKPDTTKPEITKPDVIKLDATKPTVDESTASAKGNGNSQPDGANSSAALPSKTLQPSIPPSVPNVEEPTTAPADAGTSGIAQVAQWLPVDAANKQAVVLVQAGGLPLHRLQPAESIPSGCQIFVPSANRPKLGIRGGPDWQVCGTTHLILTKPDGDASAIAQVDMRLGRALVSGSALGEHVQIVSPAGTAQVSLTGNAVATIEVSYQPIAQGSVIQRAVYVPVMTIIGIEGETAIQSNGQSIKLPAGSRTNIVSNKASANESSEPPLWVDSAFDRPVDLLAASDLAKQLSENFLIGEVLQKLATNRRPETRALAAQTLSLLGSWEWVAQPKSSLSDVRDRSFWAALLDRTRQILAAHPDNVDALAASLNQLDPQAAQWRLALWLGLSPEQLQADGSKKLLTSLEADSLVERILAIQQLQRATGKDLGFQAAEPNRTIVTQIARDLASGKLTFLPVPKS